MRSAFSRFTRLRSASSNKASTPLECSAAQDIEKGRVALSAHDMLGAVDIYAKRFRHGPLPLERDATVDRSDRGRSQAFAFAFAFA
jgi:hypothetical protein